MSTPLDDIVLKFDRLDRFVEDSLGDILKGNVIEQKVQKAVKGQMNAGKRGDYTDIEPAYKSKTVEIKKTKGQRSDIVTLRDEGQFQDHITLKHYPGRAEIISTDSKSESLQAKYGPEILDIDDANLEIIVEDDIKPMLILDVKQYF